VNAGVYTTTLTIAGLFVLVAGMSSKRSWFRKLSILTFYLTGYCIFISFSRASWLGGIIVVLGLLYLYPQFTFKTILVVSSVVLLLGGWLLADQIQWAQARLKSEESERSALSRLPVYYAAFRMFQTKPFLGWGYGNFDTYDRRFQGRVADLPNDNKDHASHNLYLTTVAEQGILGLGLYLAPVIWLAFLSLKAFPRMPANGFWSRKLLIILWLVILNHFIVNSFQNTRVVFGLGMWWITLGFIANLVYAYLKPKSSEQVELETKYALLPGVQVSGSENVSR
jgi:O-antigen ligase